MGKLIQKLNWDMSFIKNQCTFVYADADLDSNQKMQDLVFFWFYLLLIFLLEIDRLEDLLKNTDSPYDLQIKGRLNAIIEVKNDLLGRIEEVI